MHREYKESVCDMIQPLNALTPKVSFRAGSIVDSVEAAKNRKKMRVAIINATGISVVLGAATTAIARSNTSSWKNAGYCGLGVALISLMFLAPGFMYKSGVNTTKNGEKDFFTKEAKAFADLISSKNAAKTTVKALPKV